MDVGIHAKIITADHYPFGHVLTPQFFLDTPHMRALLQQVSLFIAVGCAAAATHWGVAVTCVEALGAAPLLANLIGWLVAFVVSFSGHYRLTFRHSHTPWTIAVRRFFFISAVGFVINESAYAWLLRVTAVRYDILLALILIALAVATFITSRLWAFRHKPAA
ncbi:sugar translocase [Achromobacter sp. UMC71]|nr:sugar translocase [Achromobacter sp. UMC71]